MKLVAKFEALGQECVPWSVPDVGVSRRPGAKAHRFAKKDKRLEGWQCFIRRHAAKAMEAAGMVTGPVMIAMEFYRKTPPGARHGQLWTIPVEWNDEKGKYTKRGESSPDLLNLVKAAEDACENVIYANDAQTCSLMSTRLYGPFDGVIVRVWEIEPGDFPGQGDPVPGLPNGNPPKVPRAVRIRTRGDSAPEPRRRAKRDEGRADQVGVAVPRPRRAKVREKPETSRAGELRRRGRAQ